MTAALYSKGQPAGFPFELPLRAGTPDDRVDSLGEVGERLAAVIADGKAVCSRGRRIGTSGVHWRTEKGAGGSSFSRFSQAIDEVVEARVWSGIHFHNADEQGAKIGRDVARFRDHYFFRSLRGRWDD